MQTFHLRVGLLDLVGEVTHRDLHRLESSHLVRVDLIERGEDVVPGPLQRAHVEAGARRLTLDRGRLLAKHRRRALDHRARGLVHRLHLLADQLLVGERLRDHDRGSQRGDGRRGRRTNRSNQLAVVDLDDSQGGVSLDRDGELGEDLLAAPPHRVKDVLLEDLAPLGIADRDVVDLRLEAGVELLGHVRVLAECLHLRPERLLFLGDRRVVLLQLGPAFPQGADDALDVALRLLVLGEVRTDPVTEGDDAEELAGTALGQIMLRRVQLLDRAPQLEEAFGDRCVTLAETAHGAGRPVEQPVAHIGRRADLAVGEVVDIVDTSAVVVAVNVDRPEASDERRDHGVDTLGGLRVDGHLALGLCRGDRRGRLGR